MGYVDSHFHIWDPARFSYYWWASAPDSLRRRYWLEDFLPRAKDAGIDKAVFVQTHSGIKETECLLRLSLEHPILAGVVGWVDLTSGDQVREAVARLRSGFGGPRLVGIRHQVEDETDPEWLLRKDVQKGIAALSGSGLVVDLLVRPRELPAAIKTVAAFPSQRFVVDHLGKPGGPCVSSDPWTDMISEIAGYSNTSCKVSGLFTESIVGSTAERLRPYLQHAIDVFGIDRMLWGSDWPVSTIAGDYQQTLNAILSLLPNLSVGERDWLLGGCAIETYGLQDSIATSNGETP